MTILIIILIILTCAALAFFVLIQNPKGGGLAGSFGGIGNQMMGAKQSTDVVEKGTWIAAAALLVLTLGSFILAPKTTSDANAKTKSEELNKGVKMPTMPASQPASAPATQAPASQTPAPTSGTPAPNAAPAPKK